MSVSSELLLKAAKVYEAAESVEGMKPKEVYESHKKCAPGEFNMHKEGAEGMADRFNSFMNKMVNSPAGTGIYFNRLGLGGALAGGIGGALTAPKGKMLKRTLLGAGVGGLTGLGAGAGASLGLNIAQGSRPVGLREEFSALLKDPASLHRQRNLEMGAGVLGLLGGGALTNVLANKAVKETGLDDNDEDQQGLKQAGSVSEYMSIINPLNLLGGQAIGGLVAAGTPTRSLKQQAEFDSHDSPLRAAANVLVPGLGAYRTFKRIGSGIRSPEMKALKAQRAQDKARRDQESLERTLNGISAADKNAGWKTEMLGNLINPVNLYGGSTLGAAAAAMTPTRTLNQQSEADDSTWSNIFIPGQASYNWFKRIGAASRSPEMKAMRNKATMDRRQSQKGPANEPAPAEKEPEADNKKAAAYAFGAKIAQLMRKQSAGPFDHGFTQSGAPTANWANKGYNPHKAINTPPAMKTPEGLSMASPHMDDANQARYQFATATNPKAKIDAQTAFTQAARASNSANVAVGGKPQYSPTQQPMD